jgi:hypothetical protein
MKHVNWIDDNGKKRRSMIKDTDGIEMAKYGIPSEPPDVRTLDIEAIFQELEALQHDRGLYTWQAVLVDQTGFQACLNVFKRHMIRLYRN